MKILITGGAGYIGSHVSNLLLDKGFDVTIIDSLITGNKNLVPKKAKLVISDIADTEKIESVVNNERFDLVMHFAGLIRVDESVKEPEKYNNFKDETNKRMEELSPLARNTGMPINSEKLKPGSQV